MFYVFVVFFVVLFLVFEFKMNRCVVSSVCVCFALSCFSVCGFVFFV